VTRSTKRQWLVPAGLVLLCAVPIAAGTFRLSQLAMGAPVTAENARFFTSPVPVVVHIISATLFCILGAFQFVPSLRRGGHGWHRVAGRLVLPFGLAAAVSGLWMAVFYALPSADDALLEAFRLIFGTAMVVSLILGMDAIRTRDFARHRAWMMRGYAIGVGAGTQLLTNLPWLVVFGKPEGLSQALLMGIAWVINLAVAERYIRTRPDAGRPTTPTPTPPTRRPESRVQAVG
jgi:uncharacterized membrane protein